MALMLKLPNGHVRWVAYEDHPHVQNERTGNCQGTSGDHHTAPASGTRVRDSDLSVGSCPLPVAVLKRPLLRGCYSSYYFPIPTFTVRSNDLTYQTSDSFEVCLPFHERRRSQAPARQTLGRPLGHLQFSLMALIRDPIY